MRQPLTLVITGVLLAIMAPADAAAQTLSRTFLKGAVDASSAERAVSAATPAAHVRSANDVFVLLAYAQAHLDSVQYAAHLGLRDARALSMVGGSPGLDSLKAAARLLLASASPRATASAVGAVPIAEQENARRAVALFRPLLDALAVSEAALVQVFADGAIRGSATGSDSSVARTGSLGIRIEYPGSSIIAASISIASSIDTVHAGFGERILLPLTGAALSSGLLDIRVNRRTLCPPRPTAPPSWLRRAVRSVRCIAPDHYYLGASSSRWHIRDTASTADTAIKLADTRPVTNVAIGGLWGVNLFNQSVQGNPVAVTFEAGRVWRGLNGDFAQQEDDGIRDSLLGTRFTGFFGPQFTLQLTFGAVTGSVDYYILNSMFYRAGRGRVLGLTNGQLAAGFRVDVPIFSGRM